MILTQRGKNFATSTWNFRRRRPQPRLWHQHHHQPLGQTRWTVNMLTIQQVLSPSAASGARYKLTEVQSALNVQVNTWVTLLKAYSVTYTRIWLCCRIRGTLWGQLDFLLYLVCTRITRQHQNYYVNYGVRYNLIEDQNVLNVQRNMTVIQKETCFATFMKS